MLRITPLVALVVTTPVGCVGPESQGRLGGVVVEDSAGVMIIDNGPLSAPASGEPLTASVVIGVVEGAPEYQLFRVSDAKRLGDGAIVVANAGSREIRVYEANGTHRVTAGGAGQGPAEFGYPRALVILPGDTIQVQDFMDRVYFTSDGSFVRRATGDRQALATLMQAAGGSSEGGEWLADGSYFAPVYERTESPPRPGPPFRPRMTLVRISSDFGALDTLDQFGGILQQYRDVGGERGVMPVVPPFATAAAWALGSVDGTIVVGDNATPQVHRFHPDGTRSIVRWSAEAVPVTDAEIEEWKNRQRNASWAQHQLPALERAWASMDVPETKPYYGRVMVGSDGTLWVPRGDLGHGTTMDVFTRDGRFQLTVQFPAQFRVTDSGPGWVLGVLRDENEVEYVHLCEY